MIGIKDSGKAGNTSTSATEAPVQNVNRKRNLETGFNSILEVFESAIAEAEARSRSVVEEGQRISQETTENLNRISKESEVTHRKALDESLSTIRSIERNVESAVDQKVVPVVSRIQALEDRVKSQDLLIAELEKRNKILFTALEEIGKILGNLRTSKQ